MFELQWRKKYQPLNLLQVFYPSMSAKLTPQEYGKAWFPVWKEKKIYGRSTLGILQKKNCPVLEGYFDRGLSKGPP